MKLAVGAVLACLILVGIGAVTVHALNSRRGPEQAVESYLSLIADGRAAEANAMVDPGITNAQRLLLTDEVLGAATSRIEVVNVAETSQTDSSYGTDNIFFEDGTSGGEWVTVTAKLSLDGERFEVPFAVRAGDKDFGLLNNWEIGTPLIRAITLNSYSLDTVTIGGAEVTLEDTAYVGASATQYVYFGVYPLGISENKSDYLKPDTDSVTVGATSAATAEVEAEATETLSNLVLDAVKAQATACVTPPGNMEEVCPYPLQSTELDSLAVTSEATEVTVDGESFKSGSITFTTRNNPNSLNRNPRDKTSKYTFSGTIEWPQDGGEPTITVTNSNPYYGM
ncbi:hypothetical protein [Actinomyces sp.]|uniref:hypothetical protein n=1 Tax=Actinomyces sp. TaxID=29317 RepID=UPI0026DD0238|nr:hypothetical protein [Actinomyces sp.]MDO4899977.1 hypothetical protein [Actinomyces sp.]